MNELIEAATAVVDRWDSTDWKAAPTAEVMNRLRNALAVHAAELADLSYQIFKQREENVRLVGVIARQNGDVELAESKGRQEALQGLPVDALIYATLLLRLEAGNIESVVSSKTVSTYDRQISRLIESVRAAQQENKQ